VRLAQRVTELLSPREQPYFNRTIAWGQSTLLVYISEMHTLSLGAGKQVETKKFTKVMGNKREYQMSHRVQAMVGPRRKESEPGLGCLLNGRNEVLFSPRGTFIRELLFDAIWLALELMIPTVVKRDFLIICRELLDKLLCCLD